MRGAALLAIFLFLGSASSVRGDELEELRNIVSKQGERIDQLQQKLDERSEQAAESAEGELDVSAPPKAEGSDEVTPEYVDQRIQEFANAAQSRFLISGYGEGQYVAVEDRPDGFGFRFNPSFHYRMSDRLHFTAELELGLERGEAETETETDLEFGQIDYLLTDWMTVSGGFFLTPFNAFGQRLHPSWINKMASRPPLYGGEGVGIIPIMSQVGAMVSGGQTLWSDSSKFNYAIYVVNAPTMKEEEGEDVPLAFDFGSTPNTSSDVGYGARFGFLPIPNLEIGASYQTGKIADTRFRYNLVGSDLWYYWQGLELRAEYVRLSQERDSSSPSTQGYYVQASYRLNNLIRDTGAWWGQVGRLEPVVRWAQIADFDPNEREQLAFGLNFWLYASVPLKLTYELNSGQIDDDRLFVQFSYGF